VQKAQATVVNFVSRSGQWFTWRTTSRTQRNFPELVGNGSSNSAAVACALWACRAFPEAPVVVYRKLPKNQRELIDNYPLSQLIRRPNPFYSGSLLWHATLAEYIFDGNAYWLKVRNQRGQPIMLWWVPASTMTPKWPDDGTEYISHYEYNPNGDKKFDYDPKDVVHFRFGVDPANIRKGLSPVKSVLRDIYTDDEAFNFTASILSNLGVPGLVISPAAGISINQPEADRLKILVKDKFSGDNRGDPLVLGKAGSVTVVGYNPQQMDLGTIHQKVEERISAVMGIPAIVAGLGAGLNRSTFANFKEAREAAYESFLIPNWRNFAEEIDTQLLPDFGDPEKLESGFDISRVRALQEDQDALHTRAGNDYKNGIATLDEARIAAGYEPLGEGGRVFAVPISVVLTPEDQMGVLPEPQPTADSGNPDSGNSGSDSSNSGVTPDNSGQPENIDSTPTENIPAKNGNGHSRLALTGTIKL
jgi:HK97 family phage portal protein